MHNNNSRVASRRALTWRASISRLRASTAALAGLSSLLLGTAITPHSRAAVETWSANPTDNTFTGANWTPTPTISSGDSVVFGTSSITTLNENESAGFLFSSFTFNAGASAYTISGNSFALGVGGITNNSANLETINDAFTVATAGTAFTTTAGGGNLLLGGAISGAGGLTFAGTGTTTLSGALSYTGATTVNSGTLTLSGAGTVGANTATGGFNVSTAAGQSSTLNFASSGTIATAGNLTVGGGSATSVGVVNQTAGTVTISGGRFDLANAGAYGAYNMSGGTLNVTGSGIRTGAGGGNAYIMQTGGTINTGILLLGVGTAGGSNVYYLNGGTVNDTGSLGIGITAGQYNVVTVNAGTLAAGGYIYLGGGTGGTGILNLNGGLVAGQLLQGQGTTNIVNFNGGTLRAASGAVAAFTAALTGANVYSGGAKIDTNGQAITISQPLLTTAGTTGITSLAIGSGGSGYIGAPVVTITNTGNGKGATAIANLDASGHVASITITSAGTGYDTGTTSYTLAGGTSGTAATAGTITTGANAAIDGGLTKVGAGTLTLSGVSTYNGGTTVNAGTLQLAFAAAGSNLLAPVGALNLGGGTFNVNTTATTGTVSQTLGNLTLNGGASTLSTTSSGATNGLTFTGTLTHNAGSVNFNPAAATSITLSNAANLNKAFLGNYAFFGTGAAQTYAGTSAAGVVQAATLTTANGINAFNSATTGYSYVSPGTPDQLTANRTADAALFNTAAAQTIDLNGGNTLTLNSFLVTNGALTIVNSGAGGTFNIGSGNELLIGGVSAVNIAVPIVNNGTTASALTDGNTGTLTLAGANTYTGATTVNGGTLQIGSGGTTGSLSPASAIIDNGTLVFNRSDVVTQGTQFSTAGITGTGGLTQAGSGTLTLNANNTYTGATTISAGTLTIGGAGTLGGGNYAGAILDNGALNVSSSAAQTFSGVISGTGTLAKTGTGNLTLAVINTFTGGTSVSGGTLTLGAGGGAGAVRGIVTVNTGGTLTLGVNNALGYTAGTQVSTLNINGGTVNVNGNNGDEGFITNFNLTGGTMAYAGTGAYQISAGDVTAPTVTSNASPITSVISGGLSIRSGNLPIVVASGTTPSGVDLLISGNLTGNLPFTKSGPGVLALTGTNTYNGATISAGTLEGTTAGLVGNIANNSALVFDQTLAATPLATGTYAGVISGTGTVAKNNAGIVILTGANTYSGATAVNGGILYVNGSLSTTSPISVAGGARLGGTGTVGTATIAAGGNVEGGQSNAGTLTLGGLTFSGTGTANIGNLANYTTTPAIAAGALTANGGANSVNLTVNGSVPGTGTYELLSYTGTIGGTGASAFALATLPNRATGVLDFSHAGLIDLNVTGSDFLIYTGATTNSFDTTNANFKLNSNSAATTYIDNPGDSVVFNDTAGAAHSTVTISSGDVHPTSVTFNNSAFNYTIQGTNAIAGTTGITKTGTGTLTINNTNTYTGSTAINGGTISLGSAGALGSVGTISFGGGTLQYGASNSTDYSGRFSTVAGQAYSIDTNGQTVTYATALSSAGGTLTKAGAGTLTLSAISAIAGGTTVNGGTLTLGAGGGTGAVQGIVTVNPGATLNLNAGDALGYTAGVQVATVNVNGGTVNNGSNGNQGFLTNFNLTGGAVTGGGIVRFNEDAATPPGITSLASATTSTFSPTVDDYPANGTAATLALSVAKGTTASGIDLTISGPIVQSGGAAGLTGITKTGLGTLNLTGNSTFAGPTNINAGTVILGAGGGLYAFGAVAGAVTVGSGTTLQFNANDTLGGSAAVSPVVVTVNGGTLAGNNTYTSLSNPVFNGATINSNGGTSTAFPGFSFRGAVTVGGTTPTNINPGTTGNGFNNVTLGTFNATGDAVTFNVADVTASAASDLNVNVGLVNQGTGATANGLTKTGAGTMMLTATNTYSGPTAVNAGTLIVTGSTSIGSSVTVNSGAVLGGTGTIGGALTINGGGILSVGNRALPSAAIGTLTVLGPTTLSLGSTFEAIVASSTNFSSLNDTFGAIDISSATFSVALANGAAFNDGDILHGVIGSDTGGTMFTNSTYNIGMYTFTADYTTDAGSGFFDLDVSVVPEPTTWAGFLMVGLLGVAQRRRVKTWLKAVRS